MFGKFVFKAVVVQRAEAHSGLLDRGNLAQRRAQGTKKRGVITDRGALRAAGQGEFSAEAHSGDKERGKDNGQRRTQGI